MKLTLPFLSFIIASFFLVFFHSFSAAAGISQLFFLLFVLIINHNYNYIISPPDADFYKIGLQEWTDKVVDHQYGILYDSMLPTFRTFSHVKMMEIGLGCNMTYGPGHSVHVWQKYFDEVKTFELWIAEFDSDCGKQWHDLYMSNPNIPAKHKKNLHLVYGDQANNDVLKQWIVATNATKDPFHIIVDDGGHSWKQQTNSFRGLWPIVIPGGMYFLEDIFLNFHVWFVDDDVIDNRPFTWILQALERMMTRELYTPRPPQLIENLKALHCQTSMCVFEKCALHEDGIHGQQCN